MDGIRNIRPNSLALDRRPHYRECDPAHHLECKDALP